MEIHIQAYFKKEKEGALLFILVGSIAILGSLTALYFFPFSFLVRGTAAALIAIGLFQVVLGLNVFLRTDKQTKNLLQQLSQQPSQYYSEETSRIDKVMANFKIIRKVELVLILLGLVFALMGSLGHMGHFIIGTGLGLCVQSVCSLLIDLSAEWRAGLYLYHLQKEGKQFIKS